MYSAKDIEELNAKSIEYPDGSIHTLYEAEQQQRAFERKVRATKRTLAACDEALNNLSDEEQIQKLEKNFSHYSSKLKRQESELNSFCKKNRITSRPLSPTGLWFWQKYCSKSCLEK